MLSYAFEQGAVVFETDAESMNFFRAISPKTPF
jgi:hypothetical protein